MTALVHEFWWLLFPLAWCAHGLYRAWLGYRARRDAADLLKTYARIGREPPPELLAKLSGC
ncbi:MAG: hypothetical protein J7521_17220 [Caulobacter sp.]|nr:hypothetical protein [Caulobacter sp.]